MLSFELGNKATTDLQRLTGKIQQAVDVLDALKTEERLAMQRYAFISNIGASTRIENAVLTNTEIDWLDDTLSKDARPSSFEAYKEAILNKLSKDKERSIEEVAGCREFLHYVYTQGSALRPLTETVLRQLHEQLLKYYPKARPYLGQYKIAPNSVVSINHQSGEQKNILKTADPGPATKMAMQTLVDWYRAEIDEHPWTIAVACDFIFRFLAIHPFQDGNGRMSRGLFVLTLLQAPQINLSKLTPYLAIDRKIEQNRQEYYFVLRQCSEGLFNEDPTQYKVYYFLDFMIKIMNLAVDDLPFYREKYTRFLKLNPNAKKVLACFRENPELRFSSSRLLSLIPLPRQTMIYTLNVLVNKEFLQRQGSGPLTDYQLIF